MINSNRISGEELPPATIAPGEAGEDQKGWARLHFLVDGDPEARIVLGITPEAREALSQHSPRSVVLALANALGLEIQENWARILPNGDVT